MRKQLSQARVNEAFRDGIDTPGRAGVVAVGVWPLFPSSDIAFRP